MMRLVEIGIGAVGAVFLILTTIVAQPVPRAKPSVEALVPAEPLDQKGHRADERNRLKVLGQEMGQQNIKIDDLNQKLDKLEELVREKEAERAQRERPGG